MPMDNNNIFNKIMDLKTVLGILFVAWITHSILTCFDDDFDKALLQGKNVLITGASSGIGEQMAYMYAQNGANVFITARRGDKLKQVISKCQSLGSPAAKFGYLSADMGQEADRENVVKTSLNLFGDLDQIILNHASMPSIYWWNGTDEQLSHLQDILNVNVYGNAHLTALALPSLRRTGGSVGVVGSFTGRFPTPLLITYGASKYALDGFFSGLRHEFKVTKTNVSITFCVIAQTETDTAKHLNIQFMDALNPPEWSVVTLLAPVGTPEGAANAIMKGTTLRQGEVYYPGPIRLRLFQLSRILMPELIEHVK